MIGRVPKRGQKEFKITKWLERFMYFMFIVLIVLIIVGSKSLLIGLSEILL